MGQYCHLSFATIGETAVTIHHIEVEKWNDRYDEALGGFNVQPMYPLRGQHEHDLPDGDDQIYGHGWLTLDELVNFDYSKPVLNLDGSVHTASWSEYLDDDGGFKEYFETQAVRMMNFISHYSEGIVLFHFDS